MAKFLKIIAGLIILDLVTCLICLGLIFSRLHNSPQLAKQHFQTILVLGSLINPDRKPATVTRERLNADIHLARQNPQAKVIVSGAKGDDEPISEASSMRHYLLDHGIAKNRIIMEKRARDTSQNIAYSKPYFKGKTVLVTSDFHLYRALLLADKQGLHLAGYAAATKVKNPLNYSGFYSHEILGILYAAVFDKG